MTKGEIIEGVLKELRSGRTVKRKRPSEDDEEELRDRYVMESSPLKFDLQHRDLFV